MFNEKRNVIVKDQQIEEQYHKLKNLLERTVAKYQYDFQHPEVLKVSRRLDQCVMKMMKSK
jgi:hypothetical protein